MRDARERRAGTLFLVCLAAFLWMLTLGRGTSDAASDGLSLAWVPFAGQDGELMWPTAITHAGDERLFVTEQVGRVRIVEADGTILPTPFLDISGQVNSDFYEQGLLGIAFHPHFAHNGYFFLDYTDLAGNSVISRFSVSADDPALADPTSETILLTIPQPFPNNNGGSLAFGPDGYLYISVGDGDMENNPTHTAQALDSLLGKILRIDVDRTQGGLAYAIPPDNPFAANLQAEPCGAGAAQVCAEIWVLGLRNPWRISFDRATGDLYIGDVGQYEWEEVNMQPASSEGGENYGWPCFEGSHPNPATQPCEVPRHVPPTFEYGHDMGHAITGGYVYRGHDYPWMRGHYLFGDFSGGNLWSIDPSDGWQLTGSFKTESSLSTFGEDASGELYVADWGHGLLYRVAELTPLSPKVLLPLVGK